MHGYGVQYYSSDQSKYEGMWQNSQQHGFGKLTYKDGFSDEGSYKYGKSCGWNKVQHPNGETFEGKLDKYEKRIYGTNVSVYIAFFDLLAFFLSFFLF